MTGQSDHDLSTEDRKLESHMNAAGRACVHSFLDLRSAAYARRRARNFAQSGPRTRSIGGRKWEKAEDRNTNKRAKREHLRTEVFLNQARRPVLDIGDFGQSKRIEILTWDIHLQEDFENDFLYLLSDIVRYEKLNKDREIFESKEPYSESGENFSEWAQRRIAEMRAVKEARLRDAQPPVQRLPVFKKGTIHWQGWITDYNNIVYCGSSTTTTLPTNSYDAFGHALLYNTLTPARLMQRRARDGSTKIHRPIGDKGWFGEYGWKWHRNASGCWQLGYDECGDCIPCTCCISGILFPCHCDDFEEDMAAPDEQQQCSLVEWVGMAGRRIISADEQVDCGQDSCLPHTDVVRSATAGSDSEWSLLIEHDDVQLVSSWSSLI